MTIQLVTTYDLPTWSEASTLEGSTFVLSFSYNQRESVYYMGVADAAGVDVYTGVKLMPLQFLMRKCKDPRRPAGDFLVFDNTGSVVPPALHDLAPGGRCSLLYCTSDVLQILASPNPQAVAAYLGLLKTNTLASGQSTYGQR